MSALTHKALPLAVVATLLLSCSPVIYYFGDSYPSSSSVDVYYDAAQVKKAYKTIGRMTKELVRSESDRRHMVELARKKGADAIIFSDLHLEQGKKDSDQVTVKAELIKYN